MQWQLVLMDFMNFKSHIMHLIYQPEFDYCDLNNLKV